MTTSAERAQVMVVEDVEEMREFFAQILRRGGYSVTTAGDGAEALTLLRTTHADLILLDLCLPDMDGRQLLHQLRVIPGTLDIPVVAVTGQPPALCPQVSFEVEQILYKPIPANRLLTVVEHFLSDAGHRSVERIPATVGPALASPAERSLPYRYNHPSFQV